MFEGLEMFSSVFEVEVGNVVTVGNVVVGVSEEFIDTFSGMLEKESLLILFSALFSDWPSKFRLLNGLYEF